MKRIIVKAILVLTFFSNSSIALALECNKLKAINDYVKSFYHAYQNFTHLPINVFQFPEQAYLAQACLVNHSNKQVVGYKAGLTTRNAQNKFGINSPVMGVLFNSSAENKTILIHPNKAIHWLELEFMFRVNIEVNALSDLSKPIEEIVDGIAPAVEVPVILFKDISTISGSDIIASNVGAYKYMFGEFKPINKMINRAYNIEIVRNGETLIHHKITTLANQITSLRWLLKKALLEGYSIKPNQVFLAGSLLKPLKLNEGDYQVIFTGLDTFNIRAND